MTIDKMTVDKIRVVQMTLDRMTINRMTALLKMKSLDNNDPSFLTRIHKLLQLKMRHFALAYFDS
jgi:hypothetical protein